MKDTTAALQLRAQDYAPEGRGLFVPSGAESASVAPSLASLARICMAPGFATSVRATDWPKLTALALQHGVAPMLYQRTQQQTIPPAARKHLADLYRRNFARNVILQQEQTALLETLRRDSIPALELKGTRLAELLYGDAGARQVADLDILIQPRDLEKADAALSQLGYGRVSSDSLRGLEPCRDVLYQKFLPDGGSVAVDLHLRLRPYGDRDGLTALLWRDGMNDENLLLALCLNVVTHRFARLQPWMDLATFLQARVYVLDWARVRQNALGLEWPAGVYFCLQFASQLANRRVPEPVLEALIPGPAIRSYVEMLLGRDVQSLLDRAHQIDGPRGTLAALVCEKGFAPKLALTAAVLFPRGAALRQMDPQGMSRFLPAHYAGRLARKAMHLVHSTSN